MGVYIKGMKMPTRCAECWLMDGEDSWCCACRGKHLASEFRYGIKDRPDWCPLVPVPPHGNLIDNDTDPNNYTTVWECHCSDYGPQTVMATEALYDFPTVIPAEEAKECK